MYRLVCLQKHQWYEYSDMVNNEYEYRWNESYVWYESFSYIPERLIELVFGWENRYLHNPVNDIQKQKNQFHKMDNQLIKSGKLCLHEHDDNQYFHRRYGGKKMVRR